MSGNGNKTKIEVRLTAIDKVSQTLTSVGKKVREIFRHPLKSIAKLAKATAKLAIGFAAAGAALAAAVGTAVVSCARKLSALTDAAARAGTSSSDLHKLSVVFAELGVRGADIETITTGLQRMAMTTGHVGTEGLKKVLAQIASIGDEQERIKELTRVFGRSFGPSLAHLVRQGPDAFKEGIEGCLASVVAVEDQVADSADSIADGWNRMTDGLSVGWQTFVMTIASNAVNATGKTGAQIGALVAARFAYFGEVAAIHFQKIAAFFTNCVRSWREDSEEFCVWLGTRLLQMTDAITGPIMHFFSRLWGYCKAIYNAVVATFTDDDIADAWSNTLAEQEEAWQLFHDELMKPVKMPGKNLIDTSELDKWLEEARARLEAKKEAIEGLAEATSKAASGTPLVEGAEDAADLLTDAADKISKSFKEAQGIRADSYEAQKVILANGRDRVLDSVRVTKDILGRVGDLLAAQKEGVGYLGRMAAWGTV